MKTTKVDNDSLQSYSKLMTARYHPKKKAFLSYKGVLNLIFDYAEENNYIQNIQYILGLTTVRNRTIITVRFRTVFCMEVFIWK